MRGVFVLGFVFRSFKRMAKFCDFHSNHQKKFPQIKMPSSSIICPILFLLAFSYAIALDFEFGQSAENRMKNFVSRAHLRLKAEEKVAEINRSQRKWTAKMYTHFAEMTEDEFRMMLGLLDNDDIGQFFQQNERSAKTIGLENWRMANNNNSNNHRVMLPKHFDARKAWPECSNMIEYIQDQSTCGSCWAFSSASVIQDRICIGSKGHVKVPISAQDILACTSEWLGCSGGIPEWAFHYWAGQGVCTGYNFMPSSPNAAYGCKPYAYPPSKEFIYKSTPRCEQECENPAYPKRYNEDRHYGKKDKVVNLVNATEYDIKKAIFEGGPVVAQMIVYSDLPFYRYGVYELDSKAKPLGGHAIRIIGWGEEYDGTPYWLIANSWGPEWGLNGTFKIIRSRDECGIESKGITFGTPEL